MPYNTMQIKVKAIKDAFKYNVLIECQVSIIVLHVTVTITLHASCRS